MLQTHIWNMPDLNPRPDIDCLDQDLFSFSQSLHANAGIVLQVRSQPLPISSLTNHHTIQCYTVWATDESILKYTTNK
jgi:hypothetical protein